MAGRLLLLLALFLPSAARGERSDWPMVRGDPQQSGFVRLRTAGGKRPRPWQFQASSHVWSYQPGMSVWSSAAVGLVGGQALVFVGSYDHNIYSLDALSGKRRWRFATGGGVYAPPALWHAPDGRALLYVASSDRTIYAFDADLGRREWVYTVQPWRPTIGGARLSAPCVGRTRGQNAVFVGHWVWDKSLSGHLQAGGLTALDARNGKRLWTAALGDNQVSSPIYVDTPRGGRVFVATERGNLYALDSNDGRPLWTHTERDAIKGSPAWFATAEGERLVIGSKFGLVRCLDAERGSELWHFKSGNWVDGSAAVASVGQQQVVFFGSYDAKLYALDARTGSPLWSYLTAGGIYATPALAPERDRLRVLFSSWDHHLYCVDGADGALQWSVYLGRPLWDSVTLGDSVWASATVAEINGEQVAYLGSYAGPFHAIPLAAAATQAMARPASNARFWTLLPLVLFCVTALTLLLTRRYRRAQRQLSSR